VVTVNGDRAEAAMMSSSNTAGTRVSNGDMKYDGPQQQQQQHSNAVNNDVTAEVSDALYYAWRFQCQCNNNSP